MSIGFYQKDERTFVSVTSWIDYLFGIADEIDKWTLKQGILAVIREAKKQNRILTQEEATTIGMDARFSLLEKSRDIGLETHTAIQSYHEGRKYELEEREQKYFESYLNWAKDHIFETIKQEEKVYNRELGYAGRFDWYGKMDGKFTLLDYKTSKTVRWTYGLQLACYRKCLEDTGHKVERMGIVHIKPTKRGGIPCAELHVFDTPFELVEHGIKLFRHKVSLDPYTKWHERSDIAAIQNELTQTNEKIAA